MREKERGNFDAVQSVKYAFLLGFFLYRWVFFIIDLSSNFFLSLTRCCRHRFVG
ncbi:hypothetical protein MUK42_28583 [Musa troglodytarum]|uniref:Uncharacterized protein n=1 Tax=Musa troglodytarum TaxID=320322 RepID=A0A9E7F1H0_9LILI|nr:hypothetical protein MUK42_28583 [Musa troglodytarum]